MDWGKTFELHDLEINCGNPRFREKHNLYVQIGKLYMQLHIILTHHSQEIKRLMSKLSHRSLYPRANLFLLFVIKSLDWTSVWLGVDRRRDTQRTPKPMSCPIHSSVVCTITIKTLFSTSKLHKKIKSPQN